MGQKPPIRRPTAGAGGRPGAARRLRLWGHLAGTRLTRVGLALVVVFCYTALLEVDLLRAGLNWRLDEVADRDVFADRNLDFIDEEATEKLRQTARDGVARKYDSLPAADEARNRLTELFDSLAAWAAASGEARRPLRDLKYRLLWLSVPDEVLEQVAHWSPEQREACRTYALAAVDRAYAGREIRDDVVEDMEAVRRGLSEEVSRRPVHEREFLTALLTGSDIVQPNRRLDREGTEALRDRAGDQVEPVRRTLIRGQSVIRRGRRVTAEHLRDLRALGLAQPKWDWGGLLALVCLVSLVVVILGTYVRLEQPAVYTDTRRLLLLNLLAMIALVLFRFLVWLKGEIPDISHPAIFCGATTGMVVAVLVDYRMAMMMTGALGLMMGMLQPGAGLWVAIEAWLAGRVGAMALRHVRDRNDLARAGLVVAGAGMAIAVIVQLPRNGGSGAYLAQSLGTDLLFGCGWGMLAFLLAQGLIPLLERPFACVTPFRLLDLCNISAPLLQMLKRQARGSFDSSLTIGDMAADACEAIGADPLLARACGYYHDIGKTKHPSWFIENQFGGENIHNKLEPTVSTMAIKSHVDEGVQLAREHHLPQPLIDVVAQHHGTTLISFFYYQALDRAEEGDTISEEQFRYDGPVPQFKESGIIMLADGVEAAVRAASAHGPLTERRMGEIVQGLIKRRLDDHQLDECGLTLRELNIAERAFCDFLRGMYHGRIDYPTAATKGRGR